MEMLVRVVFENGIEIVKEEPSGPWKYRQISCNLPRFHKPSEAAERFKVKPILIGFQADSGPIRSWSNTLGNDSNLPENFSEIGIENSLENRMEEIQQAVMRQLRSPRGVSNFENYLKLSQHILGAVVYRLGRVAESYAKECNVFSMSSLPIYQINEPDKREFFQTCMAPIFELETLIRDAYRFYEYHRHVLWKAFNKGDQRGYSDDFFRVVEICPSPLKEYLLENWERYGRLLRDYRADIEHNEPITHSAYNFLLQKLDGALISGHCALVKNPRERNSNRRVYPIPGPSVPDALTFGWEVTTELVKVSEMIVENLTQNGEG